MEEVVMGIYSVARFRGEIYYVAKYSPPAVVQFLPIQKPNENHPRIYHQPMSMQHVNIQALSPSPAPGMLQSTGFNIIQLVSAALSNRSRILQSIGNATLTAPGHKDTHYCRP
jgi:hypothetical protein